MLKLKDIGISLNGGYGHYSFYKQVGVMGNKNEFLPPSNVVIGRTIDKKPISVQTDCPQLVLLNDDVIWELYCSQFTPSPGPGDFHKKFQKENKLVNFIIRYYTEKNEHFEAYLKWSEEYAREKKWID